MVPEVHRDTEDRDGLLCRPTDCIQVVRLAGPSLSLWPLGLWVAWRKRGGQLAPFLHCGSKWTQLPWLLLGMWKVVSGWGPVLEECAGDPPGKYKCGQASEEKREGKGKGEELKRIVKQNVKR